MLVSLQTPSIAKSSLSSVAFPAVPSHSVLAQTAEVVSATAQTVLNNPQEHAPSNTTNSPSAPLEVAHEVTEPGSTTASAPPEEEGSEDLLLAHNYENLKMDGSEATATAVSTIATSVYPQLQTTASSQQYEQVSALISHPIHSTSSSSSASMYPVLDSSHVMSSGTAATSSECVHPLAKSSSRASSVNENENLKDILIKETQQEVTYRNWMTLGISSYRLTENIPPQNISLQTVQKICALVTEIDLSQVKKDKPLYDRLRSIVIYHAYSSNDPVTKLQAFKAYQKIDRIRASKYRPDHGLPNLSSDLNERRTAILKFIRKTSASLWNTHSTYAKRVANQITDNLLDPALESYEEELTPVLAQFLLFIAANKSTTLLSSEALESISDKLYSNTSNDQRTKSIEFAINQLIQDVLANQTTRETKMKTLINLISLEVVKKKGETFGKGNPSASAISAFLEVLREMPEYSHDTGLLAQAKEIETLLTKNFSSTDDEKGD